MTYDCKKMLTNISSFPRYVISCFRWTKKWNQKLNRIGMEEAPNHVEKEGDSTSAVDEANLSSVRLSKAVLEEEADSENKLTKETPFGEVDGEANERTVVWQMESSPPDVEQTDKNLNEPDDENAAAVVRESKNCHDGISNEQKKDDQLASIHLAIGNLEQEFQQKLKYDAHKDKIIDALHRELQEYKNELLSRLLRPVFSDIIKVMEDNKKLRSVKLETGEFDFARLRNAFEGALLDLEDLLSRNGVEAFTSEGDIFDSGRQKILKVVETSDKELNGKISERHRCGYEWEGRILRPELVSVFKHVTIA